MANRNATEVALDIEAEVKSQGLNSLKGISNEIIEIAGAGNLASESIQLLEYSLSSLQSFKGLSSIKTVSTQIKNTLSQLKHIQTSNFSANNKKSQIQNLFASTVKTVTNEKKKTGQGLTLQEDKILKEIESYNRKLDQTADKLYKSSEKLYDILDAAQKISVQDATSATLAAVAASKAATEKELAPSTIRKNEETAEALRYKNKREERIARRLEETKQGDAYADAAIKGRVSRARIQEMTAERMAAKSLKEKYLGSNFMNNIRAGAMRWEDSFTNRKGAIGFSARFGANALRNTKLGDMFNSGVAGAGVNLGAIAGGALAIGVGKLFKGIVDLDKAALDAYGSIEKVKTGLGVVYGNQGEADRIFTQISEYAVKSPFGVKETADQAVLLKQSGVASYELMDTLKMVGDLAGGNQDKMTRISNALAQISSNETATTRQLKTFTMAGVPVYEALSKVLGISTGKVRKQVESNNVTYEDVVKALKILTSEGGSFYQSVEKGARTLEARKTNLQDTKELALSNFAETGLSTFLALLPFGTSAADANKKIVSMQEGFWSWFNNKAEKGAKKNRQRKADEDDKTLAEIDARIKTAQEAGALESVKLLKVERMEVEKTLYYTDDQRENIRAQEFFDAEKNLQSELNKVSTKPIENIRIQALINAYNSGNEELIKEQEKLFSAVFPNLDDWKNKNSYEDKIAALKSWIQPQPNPELVKAQERMNELRAKAYYDENGEIKLVRTKEERAANAVSSRELLRESQERTLKIGGKDSTTSKIDAFDDFYEKTYGAKQEREKSQKELIDELRNIANEIKGLDLTNNKFAFIDRPMSVDETLEKIEKYFDTDSAETLSFDKEEDFDKNIKVLRENIDGLQSVISMALYNESFSKNGNDAFAKEVMTYITNLRNSQDSESAQASLKAIQDSMGKIQNENLKSLFSFMMSNSNVVNIDTAKLDVSEEAKRIKSAYDTAYTPLIRDLFSKNFGVSQIRLIASDLGTFGEKDVGDYESMKTAMSYAKNARERRLVANATSLLLSQTGKNKINAIDIAQNVEQSNYKPPRTQTRIGNNGNITESESYGRYRKGFIDFNKTNENIRNFAMLKGTSETLTNMAKSLETEINSINTFFTESFTAEENKDNGTKYLEAKAIEDYFKSKDKNSLSDAEKAMLEDAKKTLKIMEETGVTQQLGVLYSQEYREAVTALSIQTYEAADGTLEFGEAILKAQEKVKKELEERKETIDSLATFRSAIESLGEQIDQTRISLALMQSGYGTAKTGLSVEDNKKLFENVIKLIADEKNKGLVKQIYGDKETSVIVTDLINGALTTGKGVGLAGVETKQKELNKKEFDLRTELDKKEKELDDAKKNSLAAQYGVSSVEDLKKQAVSPVKYNINEQLLAYIAKKGKLPNGEELIFPEGKNLYAGTMSDSYLKAHPSYYNDFATDEERYEYIQKLYELNKDVFDRFFNPTQLIELAIQKIETDIHSLATEKAGIQQTALEQETANLIEEQRKLADVQQREALAKPISDYIDSIKANEPTGVSLFTDDTLLYGNNNSRQQIAVDEMGFSKGTSLKEAVNATFIDEKGKGTENIQTLAEKRLSLGLDKDGDETQKRLQELKGQDITDEDKDFLLKQTEGLANYNKVVVETRKNISELGNSMKSAFNGAVVDSISQSMVTLGENMRDGKDATEGISSGLRDIWTNLLKTIGPEMTQTGLSIAAAGAKEVASGNKAGWGYVATGLGLAAAGGFMSWAGGALSANDEEDDDDYAQKEERLKALADILGDLIDQAKTDAEYYDKNTRHRMALSTDFGTSARSVNDMILTPEGQFSTHPDDYIIATKDPNSLGGKGSPNITITIVNQSGDVVKVASTEKEENENGDIDIKAVIVAVTTEAIVKGEMDSAFAAMEQRNKGISRS